MPGSFIHDKSANCQGDLPLAFLLPFEANLGHILPVKACTYCGSDNNEDARHCLECGTEFSDSQEEMPATTFPIESGIDLSQLDMGFEISERFSRPNWKAISAFVKTNISKEDYPTVWRIIPEKWLEQMAKDLGGASRVYRSDNFLCLSDVTPEITRTLLAYAESVLGTIRGSLKEAAWTGFYGKHVLLLFSDLDDYFAYISFYYPEGSHALSSGVFLRQGYAHIALPYENTLSAEHVLVHELVHNLLSRLPIPLWLNEGLAVVIEGRVSRFPFRVDADMVDRHGRHWSEENIQAFWAGKSFNVPGEESELSYSLAPILVTLLSEKGGDFITFIRNADWRDAGQEAALTILDRDLGDVAGEFLGPGNWRPQRKAIVEQCKPKQP